VSTAHTLATRRNTHAEAWATLALFLVVGPWTLIGWMIWTFT
jgi:hypothetical protein